MTTTQDSTEDWLSEILEELLFGEHDDEHKAIDEAIDKIQEHILAEALELIEKTNRFNHAGCSFNGRVHADYCKVQTQVKESLVKAFINKYSREGKDE